MAFEQPVRVYSLGLDPRFRSMLNVFFERTGEGGYVLSEQPADVIIVDMDAVGARKAYAEHHRKNGGMPSILFSIDEQEYRTSGNIILLRKPFTVRQLQSAFEIIALRYLKRLLPASTPKKTTAAVSARPVARAKPEVSGTRKKLAGEARQAALGSLAQEEQELEEQLKPRTSKAAFSLAQHGEYIKLNTFLTGIMQDGSADTESYNPGVYLQGKLLDEIGRVRSKKKNLSVKLGGGRLLIDPEQQLVKMSMGEFQLREVASFPVNPEGFIATQVSRKKQAVDETGAGRLVSIESLIWKSALYAARGRVPEGTSLDETRQLKRWPNLTRMVLTPGAVRMSALWTTHAISIADMAKQLGLSDVDVRGFYSAAEALNLYYKADEKISTPAQSQDETEYKPKVGGLFSRIIKHLRQS